MNVSASVDAEAYRRHSSEQPFTEGQMLELSAEFYPDEPEAEALIVPDLRLQLRKLQRIGAGDVGYLFVG